jgi:Fur family transcriptional regulator, zinc uptake regulator
VRKALSRKTALREKKNQKIRPAELVLATLRRERRPLGAYDLQASLSDIQFLAPATIYRALEQLIASRLVHKIASLNAFIACHHRAPHGRSAFAICDHCGGVTEIAAPDIETVIDVCSRESGFDVSDATIELHGSCEKCSTFAPAAE